MVDFDADRVISWLFRLMLGAIAALAFAHLLSGWLTWQVGSRTGRDLLSIFDLEQETSAGTFVSALIISAGSLSAALAASRSWRSTPKLAWGWIMVSLCLAFLAFDEAVAIHDRLAGPIQKLFVTEGVLFIGWVVPYAMLATGAMALIGWLLSPLDGPTKRRLTAAAALYFSAALGLEMVEGLLLQQIGGEGTNFYQAKAKMHGDGDPLIWDVLVTIEEIAEMLGAALGVRAILLHIVGPLKGAVLRIGLLGPTPDTGIPPA